MIDSAQNNNESIKMRCLRKKLEAASPYCIRCEKKNENIAKLLEG